MGMKRKHSTPYGVLSNPDPEKFKIVKCRQMHQYLICLINYPGCTNFEGNKILAFDNWLTENELHMMGEIDPHFSDGPGVHPVARFEPTEGGWSTAVKWAEVMSVCETKSLSVAEIAQRINSDLSP